MNRKKEGMPINSMVLKWAREQSGYSIEEETKKWSKFSQWETGELQPTYSQLEEISKRYKRPIALFFFPSIPPEERIEKSLRALNEEDIIHLSPHIRKLFRKAKAFQLSLKELNFDSENLQAKKINWLNSFKHPSIQEIAKETRAILRIDLEEQKSWQSSDKALKQWRKILAENGIYVFKEAFKDNKISGFCIYDDLYPIIFLNNSMNFNRQIFTLFHELGHIILKESYLDVFDDCFWQLEHSRADHIEVKCNIFASEFLVPTENILQEIQNISMQDIDLNKLSETYKVSNEVILRKLLSINKIDQQSFGKEIKKLQKAYQNYTKEKKGSGGDYFNSQISYFGDAFLNLVISKYNQGRISIEEASEHLNLKVKSFIEIEEIFLSRGVS